MPARPKRTPVDGPVARTAWPFTVQVAGVRTSIRLEPEFRRAFAEMAEREGIAISALVTQINAERGAASLTAAVRTRVVRYWYEAFKSAPAAHQAADQQQRASST